MSERRYLTKMYSITDATSSDEIRQIYNEWADTYETELVDEQQYIMPQRAAAALERFVANKQTVILDIGCGTGLSGRAALVRGFNNLHGCDLSEGMLEHARQRGIYRHLFTADLMQPPIAVAEQTYDAALVVGVFSYAHLSADAVDEILRMLKPQGIAVLTINDHYHQEGALLEKLEALAADNKVDMLLAEHGEHIPGKNIDGWVYVVCKKWCAKNDISELS